MAVANETIINKMMQELTEAKTNPHHKETLNKHIEHVKLLCELILDEERPHSNIKTEDKTKITAEEMKAMMGQSQAQTLQNPSHRETTLDHDDANGESIFDF